MFIRSLFIFSMLLMSSVTIAMDSPKEMPIKLVEPIIAFYPHPIHLSDAKKLGFPSADNVPFISIRFVNRDDWISVDSDQNNEMRRLLRLPCTALIEQNGIIPLQNKKFLTMEKEIEFSVLAAVNTFNTTRADQGSRCGEICYCNQEHN